jgi:virginiamycin B lyase
MRPSRSATIALAGAIAALALPGAASAALPPLRASFTEYQLPAGANAQRIAKGPDGAVWLTEYRRPAIERIAADGTMTEFPIPTPADDPLPTPVGITAGPDGAIWFTEYAGSSVDRMTTDGHITRFPLPTTSSGFAIYGPRDITSGPDGALWFVEPEQGAIGRVTTSGVVSEFPVPGGGSPEGITAGPDGALWVADYGTNAIRRVATDGSMTSFPAPTPSAGLTDITSGPDGALWFTETAAGRVGRITTGGVATDYVAGTSRPSAIVGGPQGALWSDNPDAGGSEGLARIATNGSTAQLNTPAGTGDVTVGGDGNLWYLEGDVDKVLRVSVRSPRCVVPRLVHRTLVQARRLLTRANCRLGRVTRSRRDRGVPARRLVVTRQSPAAHRSRPYRARVNVRVRRR